LNLQDERLKQTWKYFDRLTYIQLLSASAWRQNDPSDPTEVLSQIQTSHNCCSLLNG